MSARLEAERLLKLRKHHLPDAYAGHEGAALVRLPMLPDSVLTAAEADAWAELLQHAAEQARSAVEEQEADRKRDAVDGVPDERDDETQRVA